jgi:[NiFe] hydrogenase assembly HybE family chaperone
MIRNWAILTAGFRRARPLRRFRITGAARIAMPTSSISSPNASNPPARDDTATRLEQVFRHIAGTRMAGLPILNDALEVEAFGFREYDGRTVGVLITPWFMNLVALPGPEDDWAAASSGASLSLDLPAGQVPCLHAHEATLGPYLSHSLYSPMQDFPDQAYARAVAAEVLRALFERPAQAGAAKAATGDGSPPEKAFSRRAFLSALLPTASRS